MSKKKPEEKPKSLYEVVEYKPWIFSKKCCECKEDVFQETIYEISIRWRDKTIEKIRYEDMPIDKYYFCSMCCNNIKEVEELFKTKYLPEYKEEEK